MSPFEQYIQELRDIRATGAAVKETSYYSPLANLLNAIGSTLKPKVRCFMQLKNLGAGMPDGGLFTARQYQRQSGDQPSDPQNPERGVIEAKGTGDDAWVTANTKQVSKYWDKYRQVLVTNYRDFVLIGQDVSGQPAKLETYRLAANEKEFWQKAQNPRAFSQEHEEQITEYLKRVMLQQATIASPQDLAWFLASYAKDARARVEKSDLPALQAIRTALEEALGISFKDEKGDRFFKSTLIQTLFYGLFSAWVLWHKQGARRGYFDWQTAAWSLHVPMVKALFEKVATPTNLGRLDLVEVLEWTGEALNRVDRKSFFTKFDEGQAVQYFYEPFLEAFDPQLRKDLGVWYTPPEIVQYMVARVDTALREELGIADGLADENVYILDPCCGTGAFLVEVLKRINQTLTEKGEDALSGSDLKEAAKNRVFGFEILTAPFVVAHLQLGLLLQNLGVPLQEDSERVGVYLTNALTGWEPPNESAKARFKQLAISYPELEQEREAAYEVKRSKPILVVLGNPPYNAFSGVAPEEEQSLVEPYKEGLISEWGIKKFNLDELYIRFFGLAERCITGKEPSRGVVCIISNFSYLRDPSYVVMRQRFLSEFDKLWFDCLNGDSRETGKLTPEGNPDPSVFSTQYNREGIRVGTTIGLMVRQEKRSQESTVRFRHFWGVEKRSKLLESLNRQDFNDTYQISKPDRENRLSLRPIGTSEAYLGWATIADLSHSQPLRAFIEARRGILIDVERAELEKRMNIYFDTTVSWNELRTQQPELTENAARFDAEKARIKVLAAEHFSQDHVRRYTVRPFDNRWCYHSIVRPLWNEPRPELWSQCWEGNAFLVTRLKTEKEAKGSPIYFSSTLVDYQAIARNVSVFPLRLRSAVANNSSAAVAEQLEIGGITDSLQVVTRANLSPNAYRYLNVLGINNVDACAETGSLIWMHAIAIGYSPDYLEENAEGIRENFPRIPLPDSKDLLISSANLGHKISLLLDPESQVEGVTKGTIHPNLRSIAVTSRVGGGKLNPDTDLALTAGWGFAGKEGVTMPGKGKIQERVYNSQELQVLGDSVQALLGANTCDIYLNKVAYWKNIPERVWDYTIGGYQVIKKWLSYREEPLLGRPLKREEVQEVSYIARRIAAILLLEPELNANYEAVKQSTYSWSRPSQ